MSGTLKKYPIGIQTFSKVREENFFYVDKTPWVYKLEEEKSGYFFLSRPRRFGKSLFLDTLSEAYLGHKEYFKGLFLEKNWDWSQKYPVLKLSWGAGIFKNPKELKVAFEENVNRWLREYGFSLDSSSQRGMFFEIIEKLHQQSGQKVIILVDEYDKPILDNITDVEVAKAMREELKNLYSVIKDADAHIKLAFITGVSRFSKVSLFSGLNNLKDISQSPGYGAICGYTQDELEEVFAPALQDVDLAEVKRWYNGYRFAEAEGVYNPFDVLRYLDSKQFSNYWFESATPTFLIDMLADKKYAAPDIEQITAGAEILNSFDVEKLSLETLLYQAGYLTIEKKIEFGADVAYTLRYPNFEVKKSLTDYILTHLVEQQRVKLPIRHKLWDALQAPDFAQFTEIFQSFFASIPADWYRKNHLSNYEGYYASIFYCYFSALGLDTRPEEPTNHGRLDMSVLMDHAVFVFEFKVVDLIADESPALQQIKNKKYHEKYTSMGKPVHLVGVEFHAEERNVIRVDWESL